MDFSDLQAKYGGFQKFQEAPQKGAGGIAGVALDLLPFGRVAEKALTGRGGNVTGGELLTEALLTAIPFGIGKATKAVKGAKAVKGLGVSGKLTKAGSGLKVGKAVGDIENIDEATKVFQRLKITGSPETQLRKINSQMSNLGRNVDSILAKKRIPVDTRVTQRINEAINDPLKFTDIDATTDGVQKFLKTHVARFTSSKDAKEVNDVVKSLNPIAKRAQDKIFRGIAPTDKEVAALVAKRAGDEVVSEIAPDVRDLKKTMAVLFERNPEVATAAEKGLNLPFIGGALKTPASVIRSAESRAGALLGGQAPQIGNRATRALGAQALVRSPRLLPGVGEETAPPAVGLEDAVLQSQSGFNETPWLENGISGPLDPITKQPIQESPYTRESLLADIQRDPQNAEDYINYYTTLSEIFVPSSTQKLTQTQQQFQNNALSALRDIGNIRQIIQQDPTTALRAGIPGGSLAERVTGTGEFAAARRNVVDAIARLRSGAAITEDEARRFSALLPAAFDTPELAQSKLDRLEMLLGSFANAQPASAGTLEEALLQAQGVR
jgi:hypothetical protein